VNPRRYRKIYESRYTTPDFDFFLCAYCGGKPSCFDHVPPLATVAAFPNKQFKAYWLVPSCTRCNLVLGGHSLLVTFLQRKAYLKRYISRRENGRVLGR